MKIHSTVLAVKMVNSTRERKFAKDFGVIFDFLFTFYTHIRLRFDRLRKMKNNTKIPFYALIADFDTDNIK